MLATIVNLDTIHNNYIDMAQTSYNATLDPSHVVINFNANTASSMISTDPNVIIRVRGRGATYPTPTVETQYNYPFVCDANIPDKYECPERLSQWGYKIPLFRKIIIIIDVSGSTNPTDRFGGRYQMNLNLNQTDQTEVTDKKCTTKTIIIAELEGVANHIIQLLRKYDVSGIDMQIYSFSSGVHKCYETSLINNDDCYDNVLTKLDKLIVFECGGTDLFLALKSIQFDDLGTELCIATDGQTFNEAETITFLKELKNVRLFVIGAGSISGADTAGARGIFVKRETYSIDGVRNNIDVHSLNLNDSTSPTNTRTATIGSISTNTSQCNINYLQSLTKVMESVGAYGPACRDYSELIAASTEYFALQINEFAVVLDTGLGMIADNVQTVLTQGSSCFTKTPFGAYIITPKFQIAVTPENYTNDFLVGDLTHNFTVDFTFDALFPHIVKNDVFITIGDYTFKPILQKNKGLRIRKIICNEVAW